MQRETEKERERESEKENFVSSFIVITNVSTYHVCELYQGGRVFPYLYDLTLTPDPPKFFLTSSIFVRYIQSSHISLILIVILIDPPSLGYRVILDRYVFDREGFNSYTCLCVYTRIVNILCFLDYR